MSDFSTNPLAKHFRQPALYLKLPSQGRWYADGAVNLPVTGEVPVYAMTARDEITLKTPDALMNGSSTVSVIHSCCPSIKNAWKMPTVDLDPLLIAIRLATYGNQMDFTTICPHCGTKNEKALNLNVLLEKITPADWSSPVVTHGLEISLKPQSYEDYNKSNMLNFEEQRIMSLVQDENLPEDVKLKQFDTMFQRLIETGINQVGRSIASIKLDDGTVVSESKYINEFLDNCDKAIWTAIKDKLEEIRQQSSYNDIDVVCENEECGKPFTTPLVFEQTNFFG